MESCADFFFLSWFFALAMAASISFLSALVSFLFVDNTIYLLIEFFLPFQYRIEVVGSVRSLLGTQDADLHDVTDNLFQGLPVLFVHGQHHKRQKDENHNERRHTCVHAAFTQKKQRNGNRSTGAEAHELTFGKVEHNLGFDCV
jgi:hypothetical protein